MNVCAECRCTLLCIKKALGIFTELIPRTRSRWQSSVRVQKRKQQTVVIVIVVCFWLCLCAKYLEKLWMDFDDIFREECARDISVSLWKDPFFQDSLLLADRAGIKWRFAVMLVFVIIGRQSEGLLIQGFDNLVITLTLTLTLTPRPICSTYMIVGLSNPRINGPSDYQYITVFAPGWMYWVLSSSCCRRVPWSLNFGW